MTQHSFEQLRDALADICTTHEAYGIDPIIEVAVDMLDTALEELAALRTWKATATPLLKVMADSLTFREVNSPSLCLLCQLDNRPELTHATDCPVTLARALLAESEILHE